MNNKIYISGRISGDAGYKQKFADAETKVRNIVFFDRHGAEVYLRTGETNYRAVNPCRMKLRGKPMEAYPYWVAMAVCLWTVARCSTVYMLRDWTVSRGARMENTLAQLLGKTIIYEEDDRRALLEMRDKIDLTDLI